MTFLISCVNCVNNIGGWFYELLYHGLEEIFLNQSGDKFYLKYKDLKVWA